MSMQTTLIAVVEDNMGRTLTTREAILLRKEAYEEIALRTPRAEDKRVVVGVVDSTEELQELLKKIETQVWSSSGISTTRISVPQLEGVLIEADVETTALILTELLMGSCNDLIKT